MTASRQRLGFVDGLRGLAALWVTCEHIYNAVRVSVDRQVFVEPIHTVLALGGHGVEIFFVLSGFVIAYAIGTSEVNGAYIGRFALRRSLRLDPPYWIAIGTYLLAAWIMRRGTYDDVDVAVLLANLAYLNHMLGVHAVVQVGWTLCLEIQFYLFFVALLAAAQQARRVARHRAATLVVLTVPLAISLAWQLGAFDDPPGYDTWFLQPWYLFFTGVLTCWVFQRRVDCRWLFVLWAVIALIPLVHREPMPPLVGLGTSVALHGVGVRQLMGRTLVQPVVQYLGRISYSLYLLHPLVGSRPIRALMPHVGANPHPIISAGLLIGAVGASIVVAHVFHMFVEQPSLRFSRRIVLSASTATRPA